MNLTGLAAIVIAGILSGTVLLPIKYVRSWQFENTWLIFSVCAYLIAPLTVAWLTVPHLANIYWQAGWHSCVLSALFGVGWGLAVILNGFGVKQVGLALANALLMGSSIAMGSLIPLLLGNTNKNSAATIAQIVVADLVIVLGVAMCAKAGLLRDRDRPKVALHAVLLCILAGLLSTLFNFALVFGRPVIDAALNQGVNASAAPNAIWGLTVSAGGIIGIGWSIWRIHKNQTWNKYSSAGSGRNALICAAMGAFWILATVLYGIGAGRLGTLGPVVGWPVYMSVIILASVLWGLGTGEWRGADKRTVGFLFGGAGLQLCAILWLGRLN